MASASHRGILESPNVTGDETIIAARNDETADTFVATDRAKIQELQSELPPVSSTPLVMSPDQAARQFLLRAFVFFRAQRPGCLLATLLHYG